MSGFSALLWLGAGLALLLGELVVPGAFLMWIGLAGLGTGAVVWFGLDGLGPQILCFAALAAAAIAVGMRFRRRPSPHVNTPDSGLVGRTAHALAFHGAEGRVRVGDSDWPARLAVAATTAPGAPLRVVAVEGLTLVVEPLDMSKP
jgi:inner membrane protein